MGLSPTGQVGVPPPNCLGGIPPSARRGYPPISAGWVPPSPREWTDRHGWKHYLPHSFGMRTVITQSRSWKFWIQDILFLLSLWFLLAFSVTCKEIPFYCISLCTNALSNFKFHETINQREFSQLNMWSKVSVEAGSPHCDKPKPRFLSNLVGYFSTKHWVAWNS